jgi:DNA-binding NarL/FixJ family response regulator
VRVIVITIHDSEEWKATCARAGADRFIPKNRLCCELPGAIAQLFPGHADGAEEKRP